MNGVIIIDKPTGWTSHDVVNRMRRILGQRSVGHLGTLDPLATGVLPLVVGNFTRLAQFYTACEKTYEGVIRFGFATTTYDADGDPVGRPQTDMSGLDQLQQVAAQFVGVIEQIPPPFSAKKVHGVPAYKLARKHKEVDLKPVQIEIKEFSISAVGGDRATFRARVASGTYMRSIAHELGQRLGCGAHLESLRRTCVAEFSIADAHTLEEIQAASDQTKHRHSEQDDANAGRRILAVAGEVNVPGVKDQPCQSDRSIGFPSEKKGEVNQSTFACEEKKKDLLSLFVHPRQLLPRFPSITADEPTVVRIRDGRSVNLPELSLAPRVKVFANQTEMVAIATRVAGTLFHPRIVFAGELASRR